MTQVKMPEPVAWATPDLSKLFGENEMLTLERFGGSRGKQKTVFSVPLITTTQAEAYAAAKVRESQQWQPIETAPQDGTPVLLFARLESAEASTRVVGSFILGEWLAQSYVGQNKAVLVPSHWMPLPPFPPLPGLASHNP